MQTQDKAKSFAFKLATDAQKKNEKKAAWQTRDGVAIAGCTGPDARANRQFPMVAMQASIADAADAAS